jgi:positive regulator of sigma E activity
MDVAKVIDVKGQMAVIKPEFTAACEKCEARSLCLGNKEGTIEALNEIGAKKGDTVEFEIKVEKLNVTLILISSIALIALLIGALIGYYWNPLNIDRSLSGGVLALLFAGIALLLLKNKGRKKELYPRITRILKEGENV